MRFTVVGDTTLDVTVRDATLVPGSDRPAAITVGPGGQGANLAVRLARQGGTVRLVTAIAPDAVGRQLEALLAAEGVEVRNVGSRRSGVVVSLVDESGERSMLSDRVSLDPTAWTEELRLMADTDWVHVSGYPLADEAGGALLAKLIGSRRATLRASVGGGSLAPNAGLADRLRAARPDLALFDRAEAEAIVGDRAEADAERSGEELAAGVAGRIGGIVVVTDGPAGAAVASAGGSWSLLGSMAPRIDATGAGDAYAAGVLVALAGSPWPPPQDDLRRALEAGGRLGAEAAGQIGAQARIPSEVRA
ncbi:MAG TPA: carbohydrate kinase family protein [Candidatus Limnocylindria bacterium]|nr:carbohydrate kinase family protein [Candidatus Limnocylindria bacterium]